MDEMQFIVDIVQGVGMWAIFAWLYMSEKKAHAETRREYREDLREIAGIRQSLTRTQGYVAEYREDNNISPN